MHSFVLQDWVKLATNNNGAVISQPEDCWLDLEQYQDVVFYLQATDQSGSPTISYQTSPTADDGLFTSMGPAVTISTTAVVVTQYLMLSAAVPLARFVRWQLTGTGTWSVTFRVMVAANAPGM